MHFLISFSYRRELVVVLALFLPLTADEPYTVYMYFACTSHRVTAPGNIRQRAEEVRSEFKDFHLIVLSGAGGMQLRFKDGCRWIEKDELSEWVANTNHQCSELANNTLEQEEEEEDWAPRLIIKRQDWRDSKIGKLPNFIQVAEELRNEELRNYSSGSNTTTQGAAIQECMSEMCFKMVASFVLNRHFALAPCRFFLREMLCHEITRGKDFRSPL